MGTKGEDKRPALKTLKMRARNPGKPTNYPCRLPRSPLPRLHVNLVHRGRRRRAASALPVSRQNYTSKDVVHQEGVPRQLRYRDRRAKIPIAANSDTFPFTPRTSK